MYLNFLAPLLGSSLLIHPQTKQARELCWSTTTHATALELPPAEGKWLDHRWSPPLQKQEQAKTEQLPIYIAHEAPKSTYLILNSPAIASIVLVKGWSKKSLSTFTKAVHTIVENNLVLSGRATCAQNWWKDPTIMIEIGAFLPPNQCNDAGHHSFVKTIDKSYHLPKVPDQLDTRGQLAYIDKNILPLVGKTDSTLQQIQKKSPLFEAKVVLLPDDYACIYTKMSHCVGDFVTYYELLDQISAADQGDPIKPINWDNPLKAKHEIFPEELSPRDLERLYGVPFILGVASHVPTMPFRKQNIILLNEEKIKEKKHEFRDKGHKGMTSNSIITAALCDANRSTDIFALTRSMRGVAPGLGLRDGGNLHVEIPFQRCAGRNPVVIQDIVEKGKYFEPNEIPFWESVTGKVGRISNCVVPMNHMSFGGCKPICYCPAKSFLDFTPLDTAVIFRVSKGQDAVLHNFQKMKQSGLLQDLMLDE